MHVPILACYRRRVGASMGKRPQRMWPMRAEAGRPLWPPDSNTGLASANHLSRVERAERQRWQSRARERRRQIPRPRAPGSGCAVALEVHPGGIATSRLPWLDDVSAGVSHSKVASRIGRATGPQPRTAPRNAWLVRVVTRRRPSCSPWSRSTRPRKAVGDRAPRDRVLKIQRDPRKCRRGDVSNSNSSTPVCCLVDKTS